jgi:carbohydrate binding protein with CBM6 domain
VVSAAHAFPGTGSWDTWADTTIPVTLDSGLNTIRLVSTSADGGPNLDDVHT